MSSPSISSVAARHVAPGGSGGTGAAMTTSINALTTLEQTPPPPLAARHELSVTDVLAQAEKVHQLLTRAMEEGVHFGTIPGTPKPTLFKAGAEKLCLLFRMDPQYESTEHYDGDHLTVKSKCVLWHVPTGQRLGSGEGLCTTREAKYAYRKKEGRRVPNPDLADQHNTVLKMAGKRALIAAVLNVTAASDLLTQDLEDEEKEPPKGPTKPAPTAPHTETEPESGREEVPAPLSRHVTAAFDEWMDAFTKPTTAKSLEALWRGVTQADLWETWSSTQQVQLTAAKNAAKKRLGLA
jgi:hypothetical protein